MSPRRRSVCLAASLVLVLLLDCSAERSPAARHHARSPSARHHAQERSVPKILTAGATIADDVPAVITAPVTPGPSSSVVVYILVLTGDDSPAVVDKVSGGGVRWREVGSVSRTPAAPRQLTMFSASEVHDGPLRILHPPCSAHRRVVGRGRVVRPDRHDHSERLARAPIVRRGLERGLGRPDPRRFRDRNRFSRLGCSPRAAPRTANPRELFRVPHRAVVAILARLGHLVGPGPRHRDRGPVRSDVTRILHRQRKPPAPDSARARPRSRRPPCVGQPPTSARWNERSGADPSTPSGAR